MTTKLLRDVKRKTLRSEWGTEAGKKLVVALEKGDIVAVKLERQKSWRRIAVHTLWTYLCRRDAEQEMKEKAKARRNRHGS